MEPSFLELPLDRELYEPKKYVSLRKDPLRILITDAGGKIAYNVIYQICSGNVFGPDQEIILHLINARGSVHHKAVVLELEQSGFSTCTEFVVSSNPEVAYAKVDIVIAIATYEEIPGRTVSNSLIYQMIKARQVAMHVQQYSSKDVKVIFAGPSTKAVTTLLGAFQKFSPGIPRCNISAVTCLDTNICKGLLSAKLKTTTDKIKNIMIWGATIPDVHYATVRMYPPGDNGQWEMEDIPITQAVQDDHWLFYTFPMAIYRRLMNHDLLKFGKAVTQSVVQHLRYLYKGSQNCSEILSMGVISPSGAIYGVPPDIGFSFPVKTENQKWEVITDMRFDIATHLNILRTIYNVSHNELNNSIMKVVSYMLDFEAAKKQVVNLYDRHFIEEVLETRHWITRYFVTPSPAEGIGKILKERVKGSKKTIAWDDEMNLLRRKLTSEKNEFIPNRNLKKKQVTGKKSKESITHFSTTENLDFILKSIGNKL